MVLGIFFLLFSFWWVGTRTLVTYMELARWFALFAFIGNLLPYRAGGLRLGMERLEWFLFNLLAVGPIVFSLLLWLNLGIHGPQRYAVLHFDGEIEAVRHYWMEHQELPNPTPLVVPSGAGPDLGQQLGPVDGRVIGTARGLFGYDVIATYERYGQRAGQY